MFLKEKPSSVLLTLRQKGKPTYLSELAREAKVTYVYLTHLVPVLQHMGLVTTMKQGKFKIVSLTDKGEELAKLLAEIKGFEGMQGVAGGQQD